MLKPKHLQPGDTVAVASLSSGSLGEPESIHKFYLAKERLAREWGLNLIAMPHALRGRDFIYCHPEARALDLMDAFRDPEIKAVFSAIGGDDTIRILPYLDLDVLRDNPKIFTGFSDTTSNHFMMHKAGLVSYYGLSLMCDLAEYVEMNEYSREMFERTLLRPQPTLDIPCSAYTCPEDDKVRWGEQNMHVRRNRHPNSGYEVLQGRGTVRGALLGGCLDVFPQLWGTPIWPAAEEWEGKLLLLESSEVDMPEEYFIWYLRTLQAQGILHRIRGIILGRPAHNEKYEIYKAALLKVLHIEAKLPELPVLYNVNVGHAYPIGVFPLGLEYELDCDRGALTLLESATE